MAHPVMPGAALPCNFYKYSKRKTPPITSGCKVNTNRQPYTSFTIFTSYDNHIPTCVLMYRFAIVKKTGILARGKLREMSLKNKKPTHTHIHIYIYIFHDLNNIKNFIYSTWMLLTDINTSTIQLNSRPNYIQSKKRSNYSPIPYRTLVYTSLVREKSNEHVQKFHIRPYLIYFCSLGKFQDKLTWVSSRQLVDLFSPYP